MERPPGSDVVHRGPHGDRAFGRAESVVGKGRSLRGLAFLRALAGGVARRHVPLLGMVRRPWLLPRGRGADPGGSITAVTLHRGGARSAMRAGRSRGFGTDPPRQTRGPLPKPTPATD